MKVLKHHPLYHDMVSELGDVTVCEKTGSNIHIVVDNVTYSLPRNDVNTYLLEACAHLSQRDFQRPGGIVTSIWNHPDRFLTFADLLDMVL